MPQTITEKILAKASGREKVSPGELITAEIDRVLCHDVTTPPAITMLEKHGMDSVFDKEKIIVTPDHFVPNKDIKSAELVRRLREWAKKHDLVHFYDLGRHGVCHALLPEQGHVLPGHVIVGADSHTCTYGALGAFSTGIGSTDLAAAIYSGSLWFRVPESMKFIIDGRMPKGVYSKDIIIRIISDIGVDGALYKTMEFSGKAVDAMSVEARMTLTNMAIEAGAKSGIIAADKKAIDYVRSRAKGEFEIFESDADAEYSQVHEYDVSAMEPMVSVPSLPSNGRPVKDLAGIRIDQAWLGSCTNGRIEDLRIAAKVLRGKKIADHVRMIVVPATTEIWKMASKEGLLDIFMDARATVSAPTCGACLGGHMGILAKGEKCISSTNRNFVGRMGHPESEVYLASPATVAASAIAGTISDPRDYL